MLMSTLAWIFHTKRWLTIVFTRLSERKPFKGLHWRRTLDQRCPDIIEFIYHSPTPAFFREYTHMDDHTRQITDTSRFTHLSPTTVFLIKDHGKTNYWWYFIHPSATPLSLDKLHSRPKSYSASFITTDTTWPKETKGSGNENRQPTVSYPEPLGLICSHRDNVIKRNYGVWER